MKKFLLVFLMLNLVACASYQAKAPVRDINVHQIGQALFHQVQPGETLYSIAWRYELDFRTLAQLNHLSLPYEVYPGQNIQLTGSLAVKKTAPSVSKKALIKPVKKAVVFHPAQREPKGKVHHWYWPVKGKIIHPFSRENKGVDIAGFYRQSVLASADGRVVYAGDGVRGYGHLIIIKHNAIYLSAYAYNSQLFVAMGDWVKRGEKIALMGMNNKGQVMLHFEIRREGKPVNPKHYLR